MSVEQESAGVRIARHATGLMARFNEAGIIGAPDVHVATRVAQLCGVAVDSDSLLAVALTVRAVRAGSVCVDLHRLRDIPPDVESGVDPDDLPWPDPAALLDALRAGPLTRPSADGGLAPVRLATSAEGAVLMYLDRYFRQEQRIRQILAERAAGRPDVDHAALLQSLAQVFSADDGTPEDGTTGGETGAGAVDVVVERPDRQRAAAVVAALSWTSILAGGPGTGKTYTAARIIALLATLHGEGIRVALAAPTGRAAASMQAAVTAQAARLSLPPVSAVTLHRLLGSRGRSNAFRHNADRPLPFDVVIVDEASMVSLTLMRHLLDAMAPHSRLVLIGDPDQLASVDAGAVLADLVGRDGGVGAADDEVLEVIDTVPELAGCDAAERAEMSRGVVRLRRRHRFGTTIGALADAVRDGDADTALALLHDADPTVALVAPEEITEVREDVVAWVAAMTDAAAVTDGGDALGALQALRRHRVLCAHREGPAGVSVWGRTAVEWAVGAGVLGGEANRPWYPGRPLLLTETDQRERLFNGDTGIVVGVGDRLVTAFERPGGAQRIAPGRLRGVTGAYAMTIHRSQGSQYHGVTVIVPPAESALLTRELLYTAITRATDRVRLVGTEAGVRAGIERKVLRASGLRTPIVEG
ncbi:exodeoxyribonuclease V subunit alpha [Williamsia sp. CHRR-6]|uniref:exodeoxyribonuclease V subunit alpha n=1 Tax=Williamsia sp. CHRR-6 TaxID=2835871 RepID=UPI001BDB24BB|nr:exodeoxyribonuclease V subunit alpha [Williamsia sp. CHRR-6]MBT0568187.1 exodeoxyribonuclease V subunit alpha [Williamsia sp. CHRR-6]